MAHLPTREVSPKQPGLRRHVLNADVEQAVAALATPRSEDSRGQAEIELAWMLRQRDGQRALALADAAEARLLAQGGAVPPALRARLALVRGEVLWLQAALDAAQAQVAIAWEAASELGDGYALSDGHWLLAWIAADRGDLDARDTELALSVDAARRAGDALRADIGEAALARSWVFRDLNAAVQRWGARYQGRALDMDPALAVWVADYCALVASKSQQMGPAVAYGVRMHEAALATGQLTRAITAASNVGFDLTRLNDLQGALEWLQQALDLARSRSWPGSLGVCLTETAETLRRLGRLDAAQALLDEALVVLRPLGRSRWQALALNYRGDLELDRGDPAAALLQFEQLRTLADALNQADLQAIARRGQAHALSYLDRPVEALRVAKAALALAQQQGDAYNQISALRVLADIHARHPDVDDDAGRALPYLQQALQIAGAIEGFATPAELLEATARELAKRGDHAAAYQLCQQALAARDRSHSEQISQRAVAMQIRQQTAQVRAEAEHHRQLAAAEARRAETLQHTGATLERLGAVGQAITATLELDAVLQTLRRHAGELLDASTLGIYLMDADGQRLRSALLIEDECELAPDLVDLSSDLRHAARCARQGVEIAIERAAADADPSQVPGSLATLSALFAPLLIGDRLLGVITVQSLRPAAYGERERLVLRSLAAYGAIALDNAAAYRQLALAHHELQLLSELSGALQACPDLTAAAACLARYGPQLLPDSRAVLYTQDASGVYGKCVAWGAAAAVVAVPDGVLITDCAALQLGQPQWWLHGGPLQQCQHARRWLPEEGLQGCLPLLADGSPFGLLQVALGTPPSGTSADRRQPLALALIEQSALALANLRLRDALSEQALRDPLTGVYNRRYLDETLPRELLRCQRGATRLAVAMIDVDYFKRINDSYGHAFGDRVLQAIAATLLSVFRRSDVVCRYGGEEFLVVLQEVGLDAAAQRVEALLRAVRGLHLEYQGQPLPAMSVSIGLAAFPQHGGDASGLVAAADAALYQAKQAGRDRMQVASAP